MIKSCLQQSCQLAMVLCVLIFSASCNDRKVPPGATSINYSSSDQLSLELPILDPRTARVKLTSFKKAPLGGSNVVDPTAEDPSDSAQKDKAQNADGEDGEKEDKADQSSEAQQPTAEEYNVDLNHLLFPKLEIEFEGANFVMLLRCPDAKKSFFSDATLGGQKLDFHAFQQQVSAGSAFAQRRFQMFWNQAQAQTGGGCVYVGHHVVRDRIYDLAAAQGRWYYLLNPCVSEGFSSTEQEGCSHHLIATESFDYDSPLSQEVRDATVELVQLESEVVAEASKIQALAVEIALKRQACETQAAIDAANESVDNAWRGAIGMVVGAAVGFWVGAILGPMLGSVSPALANVAGFSGIKRGIHYGINLFREEITAEERYEKYRKCPEVNALMDRSAESFRALDELRQKAVKIRLRIVGLDRRLANFNENLAEAYTTRDTLIPFGDDEDQD